MRVRLENLRPATTYRVQVRARASDGRTSEWSPSSTLVVPNDTTAPNKPSTPTVYSRMGNASIVWNGKDYLGNDMSSDFRKVTVHVSRNSGFTPDSTNVFSDLTGAGTVVHSELLYNTVYYFRLVAYDFAGNASPASDQASVTVTPLVDTDIIGEILDGANIIEDSIIGYDKIRGNSIVGDHIMANQIDADKMMANSIEADHIQAGAVAADKISVGGVSSNLIKNPGFEEQPSDSPPTSGWLYPLSGQIWSWYEFEMTNNGWCASTDTDSSIGRRCLVMSTSSENSGTSLTSNTFRIESEGDYSVSFNAKFVPYTEGTANNIPFTISVISADNSSFTNSTTTTVFSMVIDTTSWERFTTETFTTPTGHTYAKVKVRLYATTAPTQWFMETRIDDVNMMRVGYGAVTITQSGIRIWDKEGNEAISLSGTSEDSIKIGDGQASIESSGDVNGVNASFQSLTVDNKTLGEWLTDNGAGIIAYGQKIQYPRTALDNYSSTVQPFLEVQAEIIAGRVYDISTSNFFVQNSAAGGTSLIYLTYSIGPIDGTLPSDPWLGTINSDAEYNQVLTMARVYHPVSGYTATAQLSRLFDPAVHCLIGGGPSSYVVGQRYRIRILLAYLAESGTTRIRSLDYHPAQLYISDLGPNSFEKGRDVSIVRSMSTASSEAKALITKKYYATWSRSFTSSNQKRYDDSPYCYHGYYDSTNGNQKSMVGFSSQIATDLSGAVVRNCILTVKSLHTGTSGGMTDLTIGVHRNATKPDTWVQTSVTDRIAYGLSISPGATKSFSLGSTFGDRFKNGSANGIILGPPNTTNLANYGYFAGADMSTRPYLTITYTK